MLRKIKPSVRRFKGPRSARKVGRVVSRGRAGKWLRRPYTGQGNGKKQKGGGLEKNRLLRLEQVGWAAG